MTAHIGTIKLELQLTTVTGGPVILGEGTIDVPVQLESTREGATLTIDQDVLRHEIACALIDAARELDRSTTTADEDARRCYRHDPVQHRDRRPPWCNLCGRYADGTKVE